MNKHILFKNVGDIVKLNYLGISVFGDLTKNQDLQIVKVWSDSSEYKECLKEGYDANNCSCHLRYDLNYKNTEICALSDVMFDEIDLINIKENNTCNK